MLVMIPPAMLLFGALLNGVGLWEDDSFHFLRNHSLDCDKTHCTSYSTASTSSCLHSCADLLECVTVVHELPTGRCKIYAATPAQLALQLQPAPNSVIAIKNKVVGPGRLMNDGRFYFLSSQPRPISDAGHCRSVFWPYQHALMVRGEGHVVSKIATTLKEINFANPRKPRAEVLLRVLVGNTDFEQKLEALSSPGNDKLAIENAGILGSVRFTNIVSKWPVVEAAEPFSSYYLLCQWDPFNIWGLAEVHLKLPVSKHVSTITAIAL